MFRIETICDHRITELLTSLSWKGHFFKAHLVHSPAMSRDILNYIRLLRALSNLTLNFFKDGASSAWDGYRNFLTDIYCRCKHPYRSFLGKNVTYSLVPGTTWKRNTNPSSWMPLRSLGTPGFFRFALYYFWTSIQIPFYDNNSIFRSALIF